MAMSGITVDDELQKTLDQMKLNKSKPPIKYLIAKINKEQTKVEISSTYTVDDIAEDEDLKDCQDKIELNKKIFEKLKDSLSKDNNPYYIYFDFHAVNTEGSIKDKLVYINWCQDNSPVKLRMVHAATEPSVRKVFKSEIVANYNDLSDWDYETVNGMVRKEKM